MLVRNISLSIFMCFAYLSTLAQEDIRLNQIGYLPNAQKIAVINNSNATEFEIIKADLSQTVFSGSLSNQKYWSASEENVKIADFSSFMIPGEYVISIEGKSHSFPFTIQENNFVPLSRATLKAYYFNRASTSLEQEYAGQFARAMGHPDDEVIVHPSAASTERPAGTEISTPYGWYDAGDYNKYIVNSGISVFTLLSAYESYPEYYDTLDLNIPESDNGIPDLLDEVMWNLKWMATMQDPNDGGVYNKTTTANFSGAVMPAQATATRYVVAKGTAATLDFAAVMAMAARIYEPYDADFASEALSQAEYAWEWAEANPNIAFNNPSAQGGYPAVNTGGYGDSNFSDEFHWAAAELYISTKDDQYYNELNLPGASYNLPGWPNVRTLGLLSLIVNRKKLTAAADTTLAKEKLINLVASMANYQKNTSPYRIPNNDFYWGSNSIPANQGMLLMQAFALTKDLQYYNAALSALDYLLGRNAATYSFVTGYGDKPPMHIHHRQSEADNISEPVPGFLAGGPNPQNTDDDCGTSNYPSTLPAKAYLDDWCSYSTNEITINWNSPLVFLSGAIQYEYLTNFAGDAPDYLDVSQQKLNFSYVGNEEKKLSLFANVEWTVSGAADWLEVSPLSGNGSTVLTISTLSENVAEDSRSVKIYVEGYNELIDSVLISQNGKSKNFVIEAEDFIRMSGLQTEETSDAGGGENLGFVDSGDWAEYELDIAYPGIYTVTIRHAGMDTEGDFDVLINDEFIQNVSTPSTGGWQEWESHEIELALETGQHIMKIDFQEAGTNLNWYQFAWKEELPVTGLHSPASWQVYPIPASEVLHIVSTEGSLFTEVQLVNSAGKVIYQKSNLKQNSFDIDLSNMPEGIYFLSAIDKNQTYVKKIMVE